MNAAEYLKNELQTIAEQFPNVNIRYGYDNLIDTHIVELLPLIEYNTNEALDNAWIPLSIAFLEKYATEEIVFISSDSSLSLSTVIFEFNHKACSEENIIAELFSPIAEQLFTYDFPTNMPNSKLIGNTVFSLSGSTRTEKVDESLNYFEDLYSQAA